MTDQERGFLRGRIYQLMQDNRPRTADDMARALDAERTKCARNAGMLVSEGHFVASRSGGAPRVYEAT